MHITVTYLHCLRPRHTPAKRQEMMHAYNRDVPALFKVASDKGDMPQPQAPHIVVHPDNFAPFLTPEPSAYLSQKQRPLDNEVFFFFTGPTEWNSLPYDVRHSVSTSSFKQALKTHLFKSAYN